MGIRIPVLRKVLLRPDGRPRTIPFVGTPFAFDLMLFLALWPLWWILGVEQLVPPFFLAWEVGRWLVQNRGRFSVNAPVVWATLLALWWLVPALWLDREYADIFVKETATAWSQVFMLFLFWNAVRAAKEWSQAVRGLSLLVSYVAIGGLVFALGIWRGTITSLMGLVFPGLTGAPGGFFASIVSRGLGRLSTESVLSPFRLTSLALQPTSLSLFTLALLPFGVWRMYAARGYARWGYGLVVAGLLVCLVGTESRVAYLAFAAGLLVLALYAARSLRRPVRFALLGGVALVGLLAVLGAAAFSGGLDDLWRAVVVEWRPGSLVVRTRVYLETFNLLPEHPIAGWGVQQRVAGLRSSFSAGSHSSVLAMWFRHGIVGLVLYIGLWVSLWREVFRGLKMRAGGRDLRGFWIAAAIAFLGFNIRELADSWWWDQTVTMALWTLWGLAVALPRIVMGHHKESASATVQE